MLAIGAEIAQLEVAEGDGATWGATGDEAHQQRVRRGADRSAAHPSPPTTAGDRAAPRSRVLIPPRTRKYLLDHHLLDQVDQIPVAGPKMTIDDVDAYLRSHGSRDVPSDQYAVEPLASQQRALNYRLARSLAACIPVTVVTEIDWSAIESARQQHRSTGGPTAFAMACWAVVQAMKAHERFRSGLTADGSSLKVFHHVNLGIAVALPDDLLVTAVIHGADQLSAEQFFAAFAERVQAARQGRDQADESTTLTVSNIGQAGMRIGIPVIVAPAMATLAIGEVYQRPLPTPEGFAFRPTVSATLCFDHRVANGMGAARFMNDFRQLVETFSG